MNPNLDWSAPRERQKIEFVNFNRSRNNAKRSLSSASENDGRDSSENKKLKRKEMTHANGLPALVLLSTCPKYGTTITLEGLGILRKMIVQLLNN